jgi:hypothetical protein
MSGTDYTNTPNLGLYKPTYDADVEMWGTHINTNADILDSALSPSAMAFLPLAGGTVTGATTFSGAGSGLAVTNNATVGGTATLGGGLANYITVAGNAGTQATISVAGAGPNAQLILRGLGSGATGQVNIGGTTGGGAFQIQGANAAGGGALQLVQPTAPTSPFVFQLATNTAGVQWTNLPHRFQWTRTWSGLQTDVANRSINILNTISGTVQDPQATTGTPALGLSMITTMTNFNAGGIGFRQAQFWAQVGAGTMGPTISAFSASVSQVNGPPGVPPGWTASTAFTLGGLIINATNGALYRVETAGTSAATGPGPSGGGNAIADGTVVWSNQGPGSSASQYIGGIFGAQSNFNAGGVNGAEIGVQWGGLISSNSTSAATFYSESNGLEVDDNFQGAGISKTTGIQIVKIGQSGKFTDVGLSISGNTASLGYYRHAIRLTHASDINGYAFSAYNPNDPRGQQHVAGFIDARAVVPDGVGAAGGGFYMRWLNGQIGQAGDLRLRYASLTPTATGLAIDVPLQELTALTVTGGGANWAVGQLWQGDDGSFGRVATLSGTAVATLTIDTPSQHLTPPTTVNITAVAVSLGFVGPTGNPIWPTAATATPTYAPPATPTLSLMPNGGAVTVNGRPVNTSGVLYYTGISVGNGADTTEDVLQTFVVPAGQLANIGDRLVVEIAGLVTGSTDNKVVRVRANGAVGMGSIIITLAANTQWTGRIVLMKTGSNTQNGTATLGSATLLSAQSFGITLPDTAAITLTVTGQNNTNSVANSITCRYMTVDYVH